MADLVDANILVYCYDSGAPEKKKRAEAIVAAGLETGELRIPHQAVLEFISACTRPHGPRPPLLSWAEVAQETEMLLANFKLLLPEKPLIPLAIYGATTHGLSWYDAHMWAYAQHFGMRRLLSEDFKDGRLYGSVLAVNPFLPGKNSR